MFLMPCMEFYELDSLTNGGSCINGVISWSAERAVPKMPKGVRRGI